MPVDVLGATGLVGQHFVARLAQHPRFELRSLSASERSVGRRYGEAVSWALPGEVPRGAAELELAACVPEGPPGLALSAVEGDAAREVEEAYRDAGWLVVASTRAHRLEEHVPLVVPEVNAEHLELVTRARPGAGLILAHPNCTTVGLVLALAPLRALRPTRVTVVSLQALSGAGLAGLADAGLLGDVVTLIEGEEEKVRAETRKILGSLESGRVRPFELAIEAQCNRVPVRDGHTLSVFVEFEGDEVGPDDLRAAWAGFCARSASLELPSAPATPLQVLDPGEVPRPALHASAGRGMTAVIGRVERARPRGVRFVTVSHNAVRGAAGGALLLAELAVARGLGPGS